MALRIAVGQIASESNAGVHSRRLRFVRAVRPRSRLFVVGFFPEPPTVPLAQVLLKELDLRGSRVYGSGDFAAALTLLEAKAIQVAPLISHVLPMSRIKESMDLCRTGSDAMKVLLEI